ncbi:glycosyltransferase family 4 protein [Grimontia sp. NTOU-MAR1]|uniref:glycosyltransferase family 4 protein n=1 Tax=Grimontia sp. NTOU-MAR1 TaxID=3111011 RepID=UPI002DB82102|nr:glycosyltransferase family 4 protein [Grimontia sp. NTOU-MAR1]WRV97592.1 glycosyltransferase family 4 protein [Grimontia sp. NTOU-MAR1]
MRKKINITLSTGLSEMGGISTVINTLDNGHFQKWNVKHIATHTNDGSLFGFKKLFLFLSSILKLIYFIASREVGLVHIHMASRGSYYRKSIIVRLVKAFRVKVVLHLHGAEFQHFYYNECSNKTQLHIRQTFNYADAVIVLSTQWHSWVTTILKDPSKAHIVYNAVETLDLDRSQTEQGRILFLGRLGERKGVRDLIDAFAIVVKQLPNARLALGGDGDINTFKQQAENLGIRDSVDFLGWVSGSDKIAWLSKSDVYCLPSYNEGFPMGILEAMSANVPVVASTVGGIPDAIESGVDGLLIEAGDVEKLAEHITALIIDREMNKRLSSQAKRKFTNHFSQQAVFPKLDLIYSDLTGE